MKNYCKNALIGLAVGDALGVPVEFRNRAYLKINPVTDMLGFGTHDQPAGTWSDDSSLTFCLAESLCQGYDLKKLAGLFVAWKNAEKWTPRGVVFDIGIATREAINALESGVTPTLAGGKDEYSNGNGSLMRILPLAFHSIDQPVEKRFQLVKEVSSLTHAHIRSVLACFIYIEFAILLIRGESKKNAYKKAQLIVNQFLETQPIASQKEMDIFDRILKQDISIFAEDDIRSSGYVVSTLEASFWCLLKSETYSETVLKAVNLGEDTDTTGAVVGGLAGILYGSENIPEKWIKQLVRKNDIFELAEKLAQKYLLTF